jgi:iron complex outermembrane receptor protein
MMRGFSMRVHSVARAVRRALLIATSAAAALPAFAQQPVDDGAVLEEITVTAQRREESLQTAPVAITAIDPTILERRQIADTKQIVFNVPNLTGNSNVGQSTATTFFMRAVGTTENLATADTSVGLYVDDVYIARQAVNNFNLADIERIEVLRGPQGTLYGRNTNGGAIKIVTKKPGPENELAARGHIGNYDRYELKLSGNLAISDTLFVRVNALTQQGDGIIRNTTLNRDVNDLDYKGARIALRYLPGSNFEANFAYDYSRDETNGGYASDIGGVIRPTTGDLFRVVSNVDAAGLGRTQGAHLTLNWQLGENFSLTSITGYRDTLQQLALDLSDQNPNRYTLLQFQDNEQFTQELQLSGDISSSVRFVSGLYYFTESTEVAISDIVAPNRFNKNFNVDSDSFAAFGQLEYSRGPLTFIAGLRYTEDQRDLDIVQTSTIPGPLFNYTTASLIARGAAGQNIDPSRSFDDVTPKLGVNWEINEDLFSYLSYTEGFRSGGWTGRALRSDQYINFDPENVESWELGLKATLAGGRLRWNNALFRMEYTDLFNTLVVGGVFTVQTADANIQGLESELTFRANSWLDLFANVGVLDTKYQGVRAQNLAPELQRAPKLQGKAGASIQYPLQNGTLLVNGDVFYTDEYLVTPANLAFTAPALPASVARTGGFALVNASVGYRWGEDRYEIGLACTNCFGEEYHDAGNFIGTYAGVYAGAPRLYRLNFGVRL